MGQMNGTAQASSSVSHTVWEAAVHSLMRVLNRCSGRTAPCGSCSHWSVPCCPSSGPCATCSKGDHPAPSHWVASLGASFLPAQLPCQECGGIAALQTKCAGGLFPQNFAQKGNARFRQAKGREQPARDKGLTGDLGSTTLSQVSHLIRVSAGQQLR